MTAEFIDPADPRWATMLEWTPHDVYHLPLYTALAAKQDGGMPLAFYGESDRSAFLLPLVMRPLPAQLSEDDFDVASPYGYSGPLASDPSDAEGIGAFFSALYDRARERSIVSAFLRLHPFMGLAAELLEPWGDCVCHGETVYIDLRHSSDALWAQMRGNHRTGVKRLKRAGFTPAIDDWSRYGEFPAIYRATMARVAAADEYLFSDAYFEELPAALGERLHFCTVLAPSGEIAAAGIFTATNGVVQYHLGATSAAYLRQAPSKLLFHAVCQWAQERGDRLLNLGGGVGCDADSLLHFKAGFSRSRAEYRTCRMVLDQEKYDQLTRSWKERCAAIEPSSPPFFPGYRQGVSHRTDRSSR